MGFDETQFSAVRVFSATMKQEREVLGARVTEWLLAHPEVRIVEQSITQSSSDAYHCLSIVVFLCPSTS